VEVEYKRHPITGSYQLLDVNPRVWGWQTLAGRAGVDFPYLMWQMVHREPLPDVQARTGVRWVRMLTDLQAAVAEVCRGRLSIREYLNSFRSPLEFAVFAGDDPLPFLLDIPFLTWLAFKRKLDSLCAYKYAKNVNAEQFAEGVVVHREQEKQGTIANEGHHI
jgi:predicted ATP-grasp superfamily ATP-dependent carboligase